MLRKSRHLKHILREISVSENSELNDTANLFPIFLFLPHDAHATHRPTALLSVMCDLSTRSKRNGLTDRADFPPGAYPGLSYTVL